MILFNNNNSLKTINSQSFEWTEFVIWYGKEEDEYRGTGRVFIIAFTNNISYH